jgi:hypothetical protein
MSAQSSTETAVTDVAEMEPAARDVAMVELSAEELTAPDAAAQEIARESLEAVELELELHNQNLVSLGFEESIRAALERIGGEILFQMRIENEDCQRVAAVRLGNGDERELALVIMPPHGGLMRVEPVAQSTNPLARITESYAGLMDVFRAAA